MAFTGSRLDRFEVRELLGRGGMGEVYRAHDTRLRRDVALKLLLEDFLRDPRRLARFERETQLLASLNHPNIAALYEILAVAGSHALVLELVEGETLTERIGRGALPMSEAVAIAVQITLALEAAHEQGIVHRDLKPGNVQLRPDGTVKLLDFGLAKVFDPVAAGGDPGAVTLTAVGQPGGGAAQVLGSPAYMSPEQARGMPVDKRTDVWAFGCLLYEMLCGVRAFPGERSTDVIAKIIEREPDFSLLPEQTPAAIQRLLRRCLEKDRRRRLRDIGDARIELLEAIDNPSAQSTASGTFMGGVPVRRRFALRPVALTLVAAAMGAAAVWLALRSGSTAPVPRVTRFAIPESSLRSGGLAISKDGAQIAYMTSGGLVVRARDRLESRLVASSAITQGLPFFSPDGQWVGFRGWEALRKVPATGGEAKVLADQIFPSGAWSGGDIIFGDTRGLFRVSAAGGKPVRLAATEEVEQIVSVEVLPQRNAVLFTVIPTRGNADSSRTMATLSAARIESLDLRTGKRQLVLRGGGQPRYTSTGHLLYASGGTLYAVAFDVEHLRTRGSAVPVLTTQGSLDFDISAEGTLVYEVFSAGASSELVWVDRHGREQPLGAPPMAYLYPRISPDGKRVAIDVAADGARDVWMWDLERATLELFTKNDPSGNPIVTWSPDGRELVFGSERSGVSNVYRQAADGSGQPERLFVTDAMQMPISYVPDGRLLVSVGVTGQQRDIYLATVDGKRHIDPLIHSPANELWAEVSPDRRWISYDSDESGQFEVYVRPFPDAYGGGRWQISTGGGRQSLWSRNGRELFYRDFSGALMSVPVKPGSGFEPGRPVKILDGRNYGGAGSRGGGRTYDVTADGTRFLMVKPRGLQESPQLVVVLNWFEELKRLAPIH